MPHAPHPVPLRSLSDIRSEIDAIDDEIIALLARRFALLPEVVAYKQAHGLPAVIPKRVEEVIQRNCTNAQGTAIPTHLTPLLYKHIISAMCSAEASAIN